MWHNTLLKMLKAQSLFSARSIKKTQTKLWTIISFDMEMESEILRWLSKMPLPFINTLSREEPYQYFHQLSLRINMELL